MAYGLSPTHKIEGGGGGGVLKKGTISPGGGGGVGYYEKWTSLLGGIMLRDE